jgi:hypothetical protein
VLGLLRRAYFADVARSFGFIGCGITSVTSRVVWASLIRSAAWPSTIDDFVEHIRAARK